ncbi:hypothetical protein KY290_036227 [Solanum tuberosum]|uniref:Ty3/gypsy retrotransposon protein n=1 Tax=Solanum tuberosum TaxID=4113 RepID=A0ABQ7TTP0_SOLTU|nr:hypothetical protein KY290_036227 [Solanum tuberosum]
MGDGAHNTRLRTLDDAVKQLQEEVATHGKTLDSINSTLHDLVSQISTLSIHPSSEKSPNPSGPGPSSIPPPQNFFYQHLSSPPPNPNFNQFPPPQPTQQHPFTPFRRDKPAPIDLPKFDGQHAESWVFQANQYFDVYGIPDENRLNLASFYLEGTARDWYQWMHKNHQLIGWDHFTNALVVRFGSKSMEAPEGILAKLQMTSTVRDYLSQFEQIANRTSDVNPLMMKHCFISGLHPNIKSDVLSFRPTTLNDAISLAFLQEQKHLGQVKPPTRPNQFSKALSVSLPSQSTFSPKITSPLSSASSSLPAASLPGVGRVPFRKLTPTEIQRKRELNLCFNCDEKYQKGHRCSSPPQLFLLLSEDEPPDDSTPASPTSPSPPQDPNISSPPTEPSLLTISYQALSGGPSTVTSLRFTCHVKGQTAQVLLDDGSTHNFITSRVAKSLKLPIESSVKFSVLVGNGHSLPCLGVIRDLSITIQGHTFSTDFFVIDLHGSDLVLGVIWLATLGPIMTDYAQRLFQFKFHGKLVSWSGDPPPTLKQVQPSALRRFSQTDSISCLFRLELLSPKKNPESDHPPVLTQLLESYTDVFASPTALPPSRLQDHRIPLIPGSTPVNVRPYRYPHFQKSEIERLVSDMLKSGVIRPSFSPYSSPVLLVRKKDGTWRFCVDYRALNSITVKDRFPIPTVEELFDELHGACFFSKLDLLAGYHQIRVHPEDIEKTAFRTHDGHFEFLVMPFGLSNAPSTFQATMNSIFKPFLRQFVLVFFDDILIYSKTWQDHITHLRSIFELLRHNSLVVKRSKCHFGQSSIAYLGHIISSIGLEVDPEKIRAIESWPSLSSIKEVRGFLGLTGYYRRFVKGYAQLASPLTDLLKKDSFVWSDAASAAFIALKRALSSAPVLALPNFAKIFSVETDASGTGIGAVLCQEGHPIAFFSQKLSPRMQAASTYTREMFAITEAVQKWRQYLLGRKFLIITDQQPLKALTNQVIQTPEQQRWLSKLIGFDFEILYRPGKLNSAADALSRVPTMMALTLAVTEIALINKLRQLNRTNAKLLDLQHQLCTDPASLPQFSFQEGLLLFRNRLVIPPDHDLKKLLLEEFHSSKIGGHAGISRTFHRLSSNFYWSGMRQDVKQFVLTCQICQQMKDTCSRPSGLLLPLPIPSAIFEDISMDFITGLPSSHGRTVILVIVDRLSKYGHFIALPPKFTSHKIAEVFVQEYIRLHGFPSTIVSDRDPIFLSEFWAEINRLQGTQLAKSSAYHPQSDGQTEALNKCLEMYLRCFAADTPTSWFPLLPWAEFWYNTSYQHSSKLTPFEVVYGRPPPTIARYVLDGNTTPVVAASLRERDDTLALLKSNLQFAQARMKRYADKGRKDVAFQIGDWVFVRLRPYRQLSLRLQRHTKLSRRFFGPFQVLQRIGEVAYKLNIPPSSKIHPVFHVSALRKCLGTPDQQVTPIDLLDHSSSLMLSPESILDSRTITKGAHPVRQFLIKWQGLPLEDATWEDSHSLRQRFPDLNLEDKVHLHEGGNVTNPQDHRGALRRSSRGKQPPKYLDQYVVPNAKQGPPVLVPFPASSGAESSPA